MAARPMMVVPASAKPRQLCHPIGVVAWHGTVEQWGRAGRPLVTETSGDGVVQPGEHSPDDGAVEHAVERADDDLPEARCRGVTRVNRRHHVQ